MRFFGWFRHKSREFTDEDREEAKLVRAERAKLRKQELQIASARQELQLAQIQSRIDEITGYDGEEEDDSLESTMIKTFAPILMNKFAPQLTQAQNSQTHPLTSSDMANQVSEGVSFSDEQIRTVIDGMSPIQKMGAKMAGEEKIRTTLKEKFPAMSEQSVERAIEIIKEA